MGKLDNNKKTPYFKLYAEDFMTGVADMSFIQRGAYISLLNYQWIKGPLSTDMDVLGRMVGAFTEDEKRAVEIVLEDKFEKVDGGWVNARLSKVKEEAVAFMKKQSENGQKGGRPPGSGKTQRKARNNPEVNPKDNPDGKPEESLSYSYSLSDTDSKTESNSKTTKPPTLKKWWSEFFFTEDLEFQEAFKEWKAVRDKKKCSNSERAIRKQFNKIHEHSGGNVPTAIAIVLQSADKGWSDTYPLPKENQVQNPKGEGFIWDQK